MVEESKIVATTEKNGTEITFRPDKSIFLDYAFLDEFIQQQITHYTYLNTGLTLVLNGQKYMSKQGLRDLLTAKVNPDTYLYPIIHLQGQDIEIALTHHPHQEQYETFVNGQRTTQGGTHLVVLKEAIVKTVRDFYKKNFEASDIRQGLVIAFSIPHLNPKRKITATLVSLFYQNPIITRKFKKTITKGRIAYA